MESRTPTKTITLDNVLARRVDVPEPTGETPMRALEAVGHLSIESYFTAVRLDGRQSSLPNGVRVKRSRRPRILLRKMAAGGRITPHVRSALPIPKVR